MKLAKRNMKGFIFTLDSVFALVVAALGVSVLLYVDFTSSASFGAPVSQAYNILESMLQTTLASSSGGTAYLSYLASSYNGSNYAWPQFAHDGAATSGTGYSATAPFLLYEYAVGNNIIPSVAVNNGYAAFLAGNVAYVINATTGKLKTSYSYGLYSPTQAPAMYNNNLVYAAGSNVVVSYNLQTSGLQWSLSQANQITTPIGMVNNYLDFGTTNGFYIVYPLNGSIAAYGSTNAISQLPTYVNGEYLVTTNVKGAQNYVYAFAQTQNALVNTWNVPLAGSYTTPAISINSTIGIGSGDYFYLLTLGGNTIYQSGDLGSRIVGISGYRSNYYVQTSQNLYTFSLSGNLIASIGTVNTYQNSTPSAGSSTLYVLLNGTYFQGYSVAGNPKLLWNITMPSNYLNPEYSNLALGYGSIFVPNGNVLYVFGTYRPKPSDNLLQTIATMYLNRQGSYSNILFSSIYNSSTTGIFINSSYAPSLSVATFNSAANSYIEQGNGMLWMNNGTQPFTISIWINPSANNGVIVDELGQEAPNYGWHDSMMELFNGNVYARLWSNGCANLGPVPLNSWSNVALTWNGFYYKGYINGALTSNGLWTRTVPANVAQYNTLMYYPLGVGDATNCGLGTYFNGSMLNYQIYNITLAPSQVGRIYQNGAFAVPQLNSNLQLWWPLDGNFNDYSGIFNLGFPYSITYKTTNYLPKGLLNSYQVSKSSVPLYLNANGINRIYNVSVVIWR